MKIQTLEGNFSRIIIEDNVAHLILNNNYRGSYKITKKNTLPESLTEFLSRKNINTDNLEFSECLSADILI